MILNEQIATRILTQYEKLVETGTALPVEKLTAYYHEKSI